MKTDTIVIGYEHFFLNFLNECSYLIISTTFESITVYYT